MKAAAQKLLDHYVHRQGQIVSAMLRKSVETRDWLNTVEPRTVRAVMKRVVEEITSIDRQVGGTFKCGTLAGFWPPLAYLGLAVLFCMIYLQNHIFTDSRSLEFACSILFPQQ